MWKPAIGAVIVIFALREMFQDLFHPTKSGALSEFVGSFLFRRLRRWPAMLASAGPVTVVVVIFTWAFLLVIGFAFIYWTVFPAAFQLKTQNQPTGSDSFWWCLYFSLEMLTTLGLGDIQPTPNWLRILSACHTLIGFSLVTASITWIVLLFPALRRARTLARRVHALNDAEQQTGVSAVSPGMHNILAGIAEEVLTTRVDLVHFPILFYFYSKEERASIAHSTSLLMRFAEEGCRQDRDQLVRLTAHSLCFALNALADKIGERLQAEDTTPEAIFRAFAEFHPKSDD